MMWFVFHGRFPGEKAAALFAAKSVESFQEEGEEVVLLAPYRAGRSAESPKEYYTLKNDLRVKYLWVLDALAIPLPKRFGFRLSFITFAFSVWWYLLRHAKKDDVIYTNEMFPLLLVTFSFRKTLYEVHDFPEHSLWLYKALLKRVRFVLATNAWKRDELVKQFNVDPKKIIVEPNAVEIEQFDPKETKEEARAQLGVSSTKKIAVYTGHLYGWKGVDTLARAAEYLGDEWEVHLVGGTPEDVQVFKEEHKGAVNLFIEGPKRNHEMPLWQRVADVLVLPNTGKEKISTHYTSPMKLFEYMASGAPVVASDIPSIRQLVDEREVTFVEPDNPEALAKGIQRALGGDTSERRGRMRRAAEAHTWKGRAQRILSFVKS